MRKEIAARLAAFNDDDLLRAAALVGERLAALPELRAVRRVAAFAAFGRELDLRGFFDEFRVRGVDFHFPRRRPDGAYELAAAASDADFAPGAFGVREPRPALPRLEDAGAADIAWLVPGVAFDRKLARLGRGGGFYDRLLAGAAGVKIGVFHSCQEVPEVPSEEHDQSLDLIVTEKEILRPVAED